MKVLVAYDISDDGRLVRVAKISEDYGTRVQKSIFELEITPFHLSEMIERIEAVIDPEVDGVKYFPLCGPCAERKVVVIGKGVIVDPESEYEVY